MKDKLHVARIVTKFVAGDAVSFVIVSAFKNLVPATTRIQKIRRLVGTSVLGLMIGNVAEDYAARTFDRCVNSVKAFIKKEEPVQ